MSYNSQDVAITSDSESESGYPLDARGHPTMTQRTVQGSCHCKHIVYEATIPFPVPPALPTATRCNCTICLKTSFTSLAVPDAETNFKLLSPSTGIESLPDYQPRSKDIHHHFCDKCGVTVIGRGKYVMPEGGEWDGKKGGEEVPFFTINAATIDQPQEGLELSAIKMGYVDGRNDAWERGVKDTPYEGGLV